MSGASSPTSLPSGDSRESLHTRTPPAEPGTTSAVWRARLIAACLLLTTAAFHQGGGRVVPDTKLDLTVDPLAFLTRALSVWDPAGHLGQLQNQAYGYLFPMGPFHLLFHTAGVPDWVTQRLWWSLVLCVAFLGFWKLATAVGVGGPWSRYLGALLFALSPRFISEIAVTSIEVWPLAMAPWVLLPLLDPRPLRTRSRIVRSAVAFGCIGGVNAVATGAALVLPTLWWLTRAARLRAARDGVLWLLACLAAAAWWIGPLLLLGRYSPPFLDWIESAATTTGTASAFSALQGTTPWLVYLRVAEGPTWPGGWVLASQPILIVATTVPAVIGLAGLVSRRLPQHVFWRVSAVVGLALLTMGFLGPASGPLAPALRELLDGPLAAFRNIHKFELVVRIPLMIGFVAAVHRGAVALTGLADRHRVRVARPLLAVVTGVLVVAMAAPVVAATLPRAGGYDELPDYWRETATWLDAQPGPGSVLILPAAPFADFTWGSTRDEPLQALMRRPFAVRDAVPLGNAGSTRFLDEVERQLRTGHAGPALRDALARTGIRYLVVRGDLTATARTAPPLAVHQALERAEIPRVAAFGPPTGSAYEAPGFTVNERTLLPYPSIEIFDVGPVAEAGLVPVTALRVLTGGPDDLPAHPAISPSGVVVDAADAHALPKESAAVPDVLSDSGTRREVNYGRASNNRSDVLTVEDPGRLDRRVPDYLVDPDAPRTVLRWEGVRDVTASSSRSDANSLVHASSGESPGAALDGERSTRWVSGNYPDAVGEWWQVRLTEPTDLTGARLHIVSTEPGSALPVALDVTTDTGTTTMRFVPDEETLIGRGDGLLLDLPPGETTTLRITLRELGPGPVNGFAIAEVTIPGITAVSRLVMPPSASATPDAIAIRRQETGRDGCLRQGGRPLCALDLVSTPEEAHGLFRAFSTSEPEAAYTWSGTVRVRNTPEAERLLDAPGRATATATSTRVPSLSNRPGAVLDGDLGTGWVADAYDFLPTLTVTFPDEELRSIRGVRLTVDDNLAASRPTRVRIITSDDTARDLPVAPDGTVAFTARTSSVAITFLSWGQMQSIDAASRYVQDVPVGLSEVEILGAPDLTGPPPRQAPVAGRCGQGPTVRIGDQEVRTRVEATVGDLLADRALPWVPCSGTGDAVPSVTLGSGEHSLDAPGNHLFLPESMWLTRTDTATSSPARPWRDVATTADGGYDVPARADASVLVLPHNANAAWQAVDGGGTPLTAIRLDGRRQGYLLPAGPATTVSAHFGPAGMYRIMLAGGLGVFALLALAAVADRRRSRRDLDNDGAGEPPLRPIGESAALVGSMVVLLGLTAGVVGLVAALAATVVGVVGVLGRARLARHALVGLVVLAGTTAVTIVALHPWGGGGAALTSLSAQASVLLAWASATIRAPIPAVVLREPDPVVDTHDRLTRTMATV